MITEIDYGELIVQFGRRYDLDEFRSAAEVIPGTYADELVERIYNCLFLYSIDLCEEFEKYYAIEYSGFGTYLFWRYEFKADIILQIVDKIEQKPFVAFCKEAANLIGDPTVISTLDNILVKLGEKSDENPN
jgi:hypothetical protein